MTIVIGVALIVMAFFLVISILLQSSKDHRLSGTITGGAETFFGKQKGKTVDSFLNKLTAVVCALFFICVLAMYLVTGSGKNNNLPVEGTVTDIEEGAVADTETDAATDAETDAGEETLTTEDDPTAVPGEEETPEANTEEEPAVDTEGTEEGTEEEPAVEAEGTEEGTEEEPAVEAEEETEEEA